MHPTIKQVLGDIRQSLERLYGNKLARVVLFGSQARGDAREDSDVDVLVVLRGEIDYAEEVDRMLDEEIRLSERSGRFISFIPVSENRYADGLHPLMMNVHREGLEV